MVDLVLDHARLEPGRLDHERRAVLVLGAHAHVDGPLDLDADAGQRQAALLQRLDLVAAPLDLGVDEDAERRLRVDAVDEHAVHDAELRGGEPDAERVVHQLAHPLDLVGERGVEHLDRPGAAAQHRVAVLAHVPQRRLASRAGRGIEPVLRGSSAPRAAAVCCSCAIEPTSLATPSLRIDVDRERDVAQRAVAGGGLDGRGDRPHGDLALAGLDHDLAALAAAQAEQRRRAEDLGALRDAGRRSPRRPAPRPRAPARPPRRRRRRGRGRRTAGSAARAGARARRPGSPRCRGARRPRSTARRAPSSARARGRPRGPRPARPASWAISANVRSSARKSGKRSVLSASSTTPSVTSGKSWPLATICVPSSSPAGAAWKRLEQLRARRPWPSAVSASSRNTGTSSASRSSASIRSVPAP